MEDKKKYPYTVYDGTPMTFYGFVKISLILGLAFRAITVFGALGDTTYDFAFWYNLIFSIIQLGLSICALIGLNQMMWYGPLCYMANFGILSLDALLLLAISIFYGTNDGATAVGRLIGIMIWLIPTWIYFRHRRLLFSPPPADDPRKVQPPESKETTVPYEREAAEMVEPPILFSPIVSPPAKHSEEPSAPVQMQQETQKPKSSGYYADDFATKVEPSRSIPSDVPSGQTTVKEHPPILFCRKCGKKLLPDSDFCSYCGASTEV